MIDDALHGSGNITVAREVVVFEITKARIVGSQNHVPALSKFHRVLPVRFATRRQTGNDCLAVCPGWMQSQHRRPLFVFLTRGRKIQVRGEPIGCFDNKVDGEPFEPIARGAFCNLQIEVRLRSRRWQRTHGLLHSLQNVIAPLVPIID